MDMTGRVVLITGSSGIGAETARLAARLGARIFLASLSASECKALAAELPDAAWHEGDLSVEATAEAAVADCIHAFDRVDALFNVAGMSGRRFGDGPVHECSAEGWDVTLNANLRTMFLMSREVLRRMLEQEPAPGGQRGSIVNMSSVLAIAPEPRHFATHAYAASKGAILSLTRSMAAYYAPHRIRVNAVAPALVETPMSLRAQADPDIREFLQTKQPLTGSMIAAEDVAQAVVFLLSDAARSITGDVLTVDAGWRSGS